MQRGLLASLNRRQRQLDTLRRMLADVGQMIEVVQELANQRELTADEQLERDALDVRRDRIEKSLAEAAVTARTR